METNPLKKIQWQQVICNHCGHAWWTLTITPKVCPLCGSDPKPDPDPYLKELAKEAKEE